MILFLGNELFEVIGEDELWRKQLIQSADI